MNEKRKTLKLFFKFFLPISVILLLLFADNWGKALNLYLNQPVVGFNAFNQELFTGRSINKLAVFAFRGLLSSLFSYKLEARIYFSIILFLIYHNFFLFLEKFTETYKIQSLLIISLGAFFSVFNIFTATRLILGHDSVLLAFSFVPLLFKYILENESYFKIIFISIFILFFNVQIAPLLFLLVIFYIFIYRKEFTNKVKKIIKRESLLKLFIISISFVVLIANSLTKIPTAKGLSEIWRLRGNGVYQPLICILGLRGLWDVEIIFSEGSIFLEIWLVYPLIFLTCFGIFVREYQNKNTKFTAYVLVSFVFSVILSVVPSSGIDFLSDIYRYLFDLGLLKSLREPGKVLMFLANVYVLSIVYVLQYFALKKKMISFSIISSVTVFYILYSGNYLLNNLNYANYPKGVFEISKKLEYKDQVLVLPSAVPAYYEYCKTYTNGNIKKALNAKIYQVNDFEKFYKEYSTTPEKLSTFAKGEKLSYIIYVKNNTYKFNLEKLTCSEFVDYEFIQTCKVE